jgi:hypothetical protein
MCYYSKLRGRWKMPLLLDEVAKGSDADLNMLLWLLVLTGCMDGWKSTANLQTELRKLENQ